MSTEKVQKVNLVVFIVRYININNIKFCSVIRLCTLQTLDKYFDYNDI